MGSKRNSFSETTGRPTRGQPLPPALQQQNEPAKSDQCNGTVRPTTGAELAGSRMINQDGGDTADLADWNADKASQWFGTTGDLEVVRPETHPEAFVPVAPDGGWSWVVLLASFSSSVIIDGITFSIGLLLSDLTDCFKPPKAKVALVGSLFLGCYQIIGPVVAAMINRFGCRAVAITGALLATSAMFASSFATNMDVLLCTFGVIGGSSFGLIYLPAMISVNFYFNRRRAMANGIAVVGTPVGAVIFGPLTSRLLQVYHWSNTLIIFAGLLLHCVVFACLYRPLKPPVHMKRVHSHSVPDGLDELIAEELHSGYFTSNGHIRSVLQFASNSRIVQPLMEVDEPIENEPLRCGKNANGDAVPPGAGDVKPEIKLTDHSNEQENPEHELPRQNTNTIDITRKISICRSESGKSAQSAPSVLSAGGSDDENEDEVGDKTVLPHCADAPVSADQTKPETDPNREQNRSDESTSATYLADKVGRPDTSDQFAREPQQHVTPNIPLIRTPSGPAAKDKSTHRIAPVSCILSTPCLGGFQTYQDQFCRVSGALLDPADASNDREHHRAPGHHHHHHHRHRHHYYRYYQLSRNNPIQANRQISSSSRLLKHPSGIPTIEEGQVLGNVQPSQAAPGEQLTIQGGSGARDYSSSITVAGSTRDLVRRHRFRGSPSINSGAQLHQSALSGLTSVTCKFELVRMDCKPAVVMLPHPDVSIRDYSRPMYRSDIFYSGNVAPELVSASRTPTTQKRLSQGMGSQLLTSDFIGSGFSLRPDSISRRVSGIRRDSNARVSLSVDPEAGTYLSQPNCLESYLVSLTKIPCSPVEYGVDEVTERELVPASGWLCCRDTSIGRLICCTHVGELSDDEDSFRNISLSDCCLTCLRRLRDCRLPLVWPRAKPERKMLFKANRRESTTCSSKFEAGGDGASEQSSHVSHVGSCYRPKCASKAFTDVLCTMTDFQLIRNRGYRFALFANFFGVLGTYVPIIYITEFAIQNNIPEHMCSYLISIMGLLSIVGRLAFAWIGALLGIRPIITQTVTQILSGLLIALMPLFVNFAAQATAFGLMGLLSGPLASLSTIILCDLVGVDALTTAVGLVTLSRGLSSALGAPLAGILYDWTGNFTVPYVMSGMTIVFSGLLFGIIIWMPSYSTKKTEHI